MYLYFEQLMEDLKEHYKVQSWNIQPAALLTGINRLPVKEPNGWQLYKDVAYICEYSDFGRLDPNNNQGLFICAKCDATPPDQIYIRSRAAVVVYQTTVEELALFIAGRMYQYGNRSSEILEFSQQLLRCRSLDALLDCGYSILGNPIVVVDNDLKIVMATPSGQVRHPMYTRLLESRYFPVIYCNQDNVYEQWSVNELPVVREADESSGLPKIITKNLIINGQLVGFLQVIEYARKLQVNAPYIMELLGNLIVVQQAITPEFFRRASSGKGQFFRNILDSIDLLPQGKTEKKAKELGIVLKPNLRFILIAEAEKNDEPGVPAETLSAEAEEGVPGSYAFIFKNSIAVVCPFDNNVANFSRHIAGLSDFLQRRNMKAGVSNTFHSVCELRKYSFQALKALDIGRQLHRNKALYEYQDYALYHMIEASGQENNCEEFCMPELVQFVEQCKKNDDEELVSTLRTYLDCRCNKAQTAELLGLHPHTVKYRIDQIQSGLRVDLTEANTLLNLMISMKILEFRDNVHTAGLFPIC
jgi:PucR family transcriptional regulator, proline-responsive transcriptional activator